MYSKEYPTPYYNFTVQGSDFATDKFSKAVETQDFLCGSRAANSEENLKPEVLMKTIGTNGDG